VRRFSASSEREPGSAAWEDAEEAVKAAVERFGGIDVLVNNAASFYAGFVEELTPEQMDRQPRQLAASRAARDPCASRRRVPGGRTQHSRTPLPRTMTATGAGAEPQE
jgi:hypothetical protein